MRYDYWNSMNWYNPWYSYWTVNRITAEAAIQIALQRVPGQVIKVELDTENGLLVYEVDIRTSYGRYEVKVDANTGRIIKVDRED